MFGKVCGYFKVVVYYVELVRDNCKLRVCECIWKKFLVFKCSCDKCVYWGYDLIEDLGIYYGVMVIVFFYCRIDGFE